MNQIKYCFCSSCAILSQNFARYTAVSHLVVISYHSNLCRFLCTCLIWILYWLCRGRECRSQTEQSLVRLWHLPYTSLVCLYLVLPSTSPIWISHLLNIAGKNNLQKHRWLRMQIWLFNFLNSCFDKKDQSEIVVC